MPKFGSRHLCLLGLLVLVNFVAHGWSQRSEKIAPAQDPSQKPQKVKAEPKDAFKKWLSEEVPYVITPQERAAYLALSTDEERENFIKYFWDRRDPSPETEENEFREEYYERMAYANEHFSSGIPGWKTDRGRIYITWGKPDSIEAHPSGGNYNRPSYEGGGDTTTYPFEIWFYRHLDNVGDGLEIEFVDRSGTGEYRLARDANEKDALALVPGLNTRYGGQSDGSNGFKREQDNPLARNILIRDLTNPPQIKFVDLAAIAGGNSGVVDNNALDFDIRIDFFRQSDDQTITAFTVQTNNKELRFEDVGGMQQATMNIFGQVTAVAGKRSGVFEDSVTTSATVEELSHNLDRRSIYQKLIKLTPGTYKVAVVVRDVNTGNRGLVNMGFVVPKYDEKNLSTSSMILTANLRSTTERDIGQMFVIGNAKVIPNLSGIYKKGDDVGIYMQVYNAGIDQTTLRPAVDVDYILTKGGKEVYRQAEDWSGLSDSGQRLTLARLMPTATLAPGDYEIKVQIKDRVGGQLIENKGRFTITQ